MTERSRRPGAFLNPDEAAAVAAAIAAAERRSSGEIRVVIARKAHGGALDEALRTFRRLKLHETAERNAVLILLCTASHSFAILGDEGVHRYVGQEGWDGIRTGMAERFRQDDFAGGLVYAVENVGRVLAEHFPCQGCDVNELPDAVVEE